MHLSIDVLKCSCLRAEGLERKARETVSLSRTFSHSALELKPLSLKLISYQHTLWTKWSKKNNRDKNGQKEKEA